MKPLIMVSVILLASIFGAYSTEDTSVSMREGPITSYETMSVAPLNPSSIVSQTLDS